MPRNIRLSLDLVYKFPSRRKSLNRPFSSYLQQNWPHQTSTIPLIRPTKTSPPPRPSPATSLRSFTTTPVLSKKGAKANRDSHRAVTDSTTNNVGDENDPFNLSQLDDGIAQAILRLKDELSKLRAGGRFNPEFIENLRVQLVKGKNETVKLGEVAQVVPRGGRVVGVMVGEAEHLRAVTSAIQSSTLSLTPQPDAQNALQLNVPIPPPTKESRMQAVDTAKKVMEKASATVREARGKQQKRLKGLRLGKERVREDDVRRAGEVMEKRVKKGMDDVKEVFEGVRRALEQG